LDCGRKLEYTGDGRLIVCSEGFVIDVNAAKVIAEHKPSAGRPVAVSSDSRWAATVDSEERILVWDINTLRTETILGGVGKEVWALGFSNDGCDLSWGNTLKKGSRENDQGELALEIGLPCAERPIAAPRKMSRPVTEYTTPITKKGEISLELDGPNAGNLYFLHIMRDLTPIATLDARLRGFRHQVFTFMPDSTTVISGGANGELYAYDLANLTVDKFAGHLGYVYALAVRPDGKLLASGATDQTINLWNAKTHELLVTFFYGTDGEWVMWTPQGYYTSSPNGDRMVGWQINRGPNGQPSTLPPISFAGIFTDRTSSNKRSSNSALAPPWLRRPGRTSHW
jgi:WD40 repeat protein